MNTTANTLFVKTHDSWGGSSFSVTDENNHIYYKSTTKALALSVCSYMGSSVDFLMFSPSMITMHSSAFGKFNALVTKSMLGRPIKKDELTKSVININNKVSIIWDTGFLEMNGTYTSFLGLSSLECIFKLIMKNQGTKVPL